MAVRPDVVVPNTKEAKAGIQLGGIRNCPAIQFVLERAEEAFDPSVLPRATWLGSLVADAEQAQARSECGRSENRLIVCANEFGLAVDMDRAGDLGQKRKGGLVSQALEGQTGA